MWKESLHVQLYVGVCKKNCLWLSWVDCKVIRAESIVKRGQAYFEFSLSNMKMILVIISVLVSESCITDFCSIFMNDASVYNHSFVLFFTCTTDHLFSFLTLFLETPIQPTPLFLTTGGPTASLFFNPSVHVCSLWSFLLISVQTLACASCLSSHQLHRRSVWSESRDTWCSLAGQQVYGDCQ